MTYSRALGFSVTRNWFTDGNFESLVDGALWELQADGGADLHDYENPGYAGYHGGVQVDSPTGFAPERIVFQLAYLGFRQATDAQILASLQASITNILATWTSCTRLDLIPIVGGPNHGVCTIGGKKVDASLMHPRMDTAIASAVNGTTVFAGPDLLLDNCNGYADKLGHLNASGSADIAAKVAAFYP